MLQCTMVTCGGFSRRTALFVNVSGTYMGSSKNLVKVSNTLHLELEISLTLFSKRMIGVKCLER